MPTQRDIIDSFNSAGIAAFGIAMPILAPNWTDANTPTASDADMSLSLASGTWLGPAAGTLTRIEGSSVGVTLVRPNGALVTGPGMLLTLYPHLYLRLVRLYAKVLEGSDGSHSVRPVPRYFFFAGSLDSSDKSGGINPGDEVSQTGVMTIYDTDGMPIDPVAVATAFFALMNKHHVLQKNKPFDPNPQVKSIADLAAATETRLRMSDFAGKPYDGSHLNGKTNVAVASGLFKLSGTGGITKEAASASFPAADRRLMLLGPATTGKLSDSFTPLAPASGITLKRDFFSMRVVQLKPYLLGTPDPDYRATQLEHRPTIRIHEAMSLLADGNDVMAAGAAALAGSPDEALVVAQKIEGTFAVPPAAGTSAHWPAFPATSATPDPAGPLAIALRDSFNPTAHFFDDGDPNTANVDVVLTLNGLPVEAHVRVYNRKFVTDAKEARGDGVGGTVPAGGSITLFLKDPLALRRPGIPDSATLIPEHPILRFDVIVVKRTGESRIYGNVALPLATDTAPPPGPTGSNPFGSAERRGISNSGVLGLGIHGGSLPNDILEAILAMASDGPPRDAPRWPTMARRDLMVAGHSGGNWRGVLAGGRLTAETHSAQPRLGSPGGLGGRETQVVGVSSQNGRLAFDIARMAFRRTTNIVTRMEALAEDRWNEPAEPAEANGTVAAAVLQSISRFCETPELAILLPIIDPAGFTFPSTFNALVDLVKSKLVPGNIPFRQQILNAIDTLKNDNTLNENKKDRLFNELYGEIVSACYGRRDAQWALKDAIGRARRFIYIETPGFAATQKDYAAAGQTVPPYAADLLAAMAARLQAATGLHVIICTPKFPDFAAGYEPMAANEAADRRTRVLALPTASAVDGSRVVSFHPVGFPGRPSRLESTVVIVDDVWALVGSSTFRRRGLTFDGGSDVVFTDVDLVDGRSSNIANFRRQLMAARLGVNTSKTDAFGVMPDANFVTLNDGVEAFHTIRSMLFAGGLGKIERLFNGDMGIPPDGVSFDLANPDGQEFDLASALALTILAGLNAF